MQTSDKAALARAAEAFAAIAAPGPALCEHVAALLVLPTPPRVALLGPAGDGGVWAHIPDRAALRAVYAHTAEPPLLCTVAAAEPAAAAALVAALPCGSIDPLAPVPEPLLLRLLRTRALALAELVYRRWCAVPAVPPPCREPARASTWTTSAFVGFDDDDDGNDDGCSIYNSTTSGGGDTEADADAYDELAGCATASGDASWLETALAAGAHGLACAMAERAGCAPLHRTADGRTLAEVVLGARDVPAPVQRALLAAMLRAHTTTLLAHMSDGRTLFSHLLARQLVLREDSEEGGEDSLLCEALAATATTGLERLDDGTTVLEALLAAVPRSRACEAACVALAARGGVGAHAVLSTGRTVFEAAAAVPARALAAALAAQPGTRPLARGSDGRTVLEVAVAAHCDAAAAALLAAGRVPRTALLATGRTAFEHAVRARCPPAVVRAAVAGQGLTARTLLPPHGLTALEIALADPSGAGSSASDTGVDAARLLLGAAPDLLAPVRPRDSRETVLELLVRTADALAAELVAAQPAVTADTPLPSHRTCLEAAAARAVRTTRVLTDRAQELQFLSQPM